MVVVVEVEHDDDDKTNDGGAPGRRLRRSGPTASDWNISLCNPCLYILIRRGCKW